MNENIEFHKEDVEFLFRWVCGNSDLKTAKWLYCLSKANNIKININAMDESSYYWSTAFERACGSGRLDIAQWLYCLSKTDDNIKIDIQNHNVYAFQWACENGHIEIAKWLYSLSKTDDNTKIHINTLDEYAFRSSCRNGHLEIAKWLYCISKTDNNTKINIYSDNDYAFIWSCRNGHSATTEWLCKLSNKYIIRQQSYKYLIKNSDNNLVDGIRTEDCMICLSHDYTYWIKFECGHEICGLCFVILLKCPLKCNCECVPIEKYMRAHNIILQLIYHALVDSLGTPLSIYLSSSIDYDSNYIKKLIDSDSNFIDKHLIFNNNKELLLFKFC